MNEPDHFQIDTIYNADALEWMRNLPDGCVDHCLTSPPYNFCLRVLGDKYVPRSKNERNFGGDVTNKYSNGLGDSLGMDEYFEWQSACVEEMMRISTGVVFYNVQIVSGNKPAVLRLLGRFADIVRDVLVWDKCAAEPAALPNVLNSEYELVVAFDHGNCKARQFRVFNAERGGALQRPPNRKEPRERLPRGVSARPADRSGAQLHAGGRPCVRPVHGKRDNGRRLPPHKAPLRGLRARSDRPQERTGQDLRGNGAADPVLAPSTPSTAP